MKRLVLVLTALAASAVLADASQPDAQTNTAEKTRRKLDRAQMRQRWYARTGGEVQVPGSKTGRIVFVNAQGEKNRDLISQIALDFAEQHKITVDVEEGAFSLPKPAVKGEASLFVVNDANLPMILHAPEDRWTMANFAHLGEGRGAKPQFYDERVKKELTRGVCLLAGAQTSNYPDSLLTSVTKPDDLDRFLGCRLQVDIQERFVPYLKGLGITPAKFVTYRQACQEGWAPAPTNDVQRTIWEKTHQIPDRPMTIEFDPKKDK